MSRVQFGDGINWDFEARRAAAEGWVAPHDSELIRNLRLWLPHEDRPRRVLDAGCNIGNFAGMFMAAGFEYTGVDQSAVALELACGRYPQATWIEGMLWDMEFGEPFDLVFCNAVLQHNNHAEKARILPRIAAATKPGGMFIMQESTVLEETATQLTHEGWIQAVLQHGYVLQGTWHKNPEGLNDAYAFWRNA